MDPVELAKIIARNWAVIVSAPIPFMAAGALGLILGWLSAWVILRNRLVHHRELIDHYKDALAEKAPNILAAKVAAPLPVLSSKKMILGLSLFAIGVLLASLGAAVIYNLSAAQSVQSGDAPAVLKQRAERKEQLQKFYIEAGNLLEATLPKDISADDFQKYATAVDMWLNATATWIENNLGPAAKAKFLDRSSSMSLSFGKKVNEAHNNILNALTAFRKNLSTLIETPAWDKS